ncbi:MAG: hypothetical protein HKN87_02200, partial [Saprospiraceae bacterium]|nr:hypothetical protein [Saprospiraceae bacterium]
QGLDIDRLSNRIYFSEGSKEIYSTDLLGDNLQVKPFAFEVEAISLHPSKDRFYFSGQRTAAGIGELSSGMEI